ncbi:MAG TPA: hypothetical protein VK728_03730 [Candidatus Sulfotelmatobacter sp.]|jgi:hypothetical protein|nr:hypothetical protein [Candidatus Sulfotelmatobacter sp.]
MKQAAVGFRVHSGWSALVTLSLENGAPVVLKRERVHLVKTFIYKFRQPYHTAERMPLEKAREFVAGSLSKAKRLATCALRATQTELGDQGYEVAGCALLIASGRTLPGLEGILQSHALIHSADGELFREALRCSSADCGLEMACIRERELLDHGVKTLRTRRDTLLRRLTELGGAFGSPWTQDEKYSALAAWLVLAELA